MVTNFCRTNTKIIPMGLEYDTLDNLSLIVLKLQQFTIQYNNRRIPIVCTSSSKVIDLKFVQVLYK